MLAGEEQKSGKLFLASTIYPIKRQAISDLPLSFYYIPVGSAMRRFVKAAKFLTAAVGKGPRNGSATFSGVGMESLGEKSPPSTTFSVVVF